MEKSSNVLETDFSESGCVSKTMQRVLLLVVPIYRSQLKNSKLEI